MAKKYIDAGKLKAEIKNSIRAYELHGISGPYEGGELDAYREILSIIDSLQQEQPDFPTTDEEIEIFLATHPKVEVPNKYKTPDWLWKKQEQLEVDLEKFTKKMDDWKARFNRPDDISIKATMAFTARMFYMYPKAAREWYESLPKATMDYARKEENK